MNQQEPRKRLPGDPVAGGEVPTEVAKLTIKVEPVAVTMAEPPVVAATGAGGRDLAHPATGIGWLSKNRGGVTAIRNRIRAAIEAEAAAVPAASAEAIETELALIMSRRPGGEALEQRHWPHALPVSQPWGNPADYEPTAAADLRIWLVPS